ncbi:MAG: sigma-70 family RNA polymerase sigma factor, partial [Oscillospiraceae bacterium]
MFEPLIKLDDPMGDMQRYKKTGNMKIRNDLVLYYSYIPKAVAAKLKFVSCDASVIEDIINEGMIALMECIEKYDEARGVKFDTYAFFRVRGAALDFIRKQDFLPHRVRKKARDIEKAYNELANKNLREPTDEELAEFLGEDVLSVQKHYGEITNSVMLSFEEMLSEDFSSGDNGVKTAGKDSPEETAIAKELSEKLASIISA